MGAMVEDWEIEALLARHGLVHDRAQLLRDYGGEAAAMLSALSGEWEPLRPVLAQPGVATRWRRFLRWLEETHPCLEPESALAGFARSLGRRTSYRALALTDAELHAVDAADAMPSSGHLKVDADEVAAYLRQEGLRSVIKRRVTDLGSLALDPSLSLHDHPETAVCVAETYLDPPDRLIYRFEFDLPVIELLGWRVCDATGDAAWFRHRGIWFDPTNPRTERFALLQIPFLSRRCRSHRVFASLEETADYLRDFAAEQNRRHALVP